MQLGCVSAHRTASWDAVCPVGFSTMKSDQILTTLRARGERLTPVRRLMIELFVQSEAPISAEDVRIALVKNKLAVNKTTVYREFEFLLTAGFIRPVYLNDKRKYFELALLDNEHHHHVVCRDCGRVEDVEVEGVEKLLAPLEKKLAKKIKFADIRHSLEFFGWCGKCRQT